MTIFCSPDSKRLFGQPETGNKSDRNKSDRINVGSLANLGRHLTNQQIISKAN